VQRRNDLKLGGRQGGDSDRATTTYDISHAHGRQQVTKAQGPSSDAAPQAEKPGVADR
jgi:hypothetical protein